MINGSSRVRWDEGGSDDSSSTWYLSVEEYLNSKTVLFGSLEEETKSFPAGFHSYNFECALPDRLPGNVKGLYGKISYKVKLTVDIPWGRDIKVKEPFYVFNVVDLNHNPLLRSPIDCQLVKKFTVFFGANEAILDVALPQRAFVPNEVIPIKCRINNKSNVEFTSVKFRLNQIVTFKATIPIPKENTMKETLAVDTYRIKDSRKTMFQIRGMIKVPICPVSCAISSNIHTHYVIKVTGVVSGMHKNAEVEIPVEIGTIALLPLAK